MALSLVSAAMSPIVSAALPEISWVSPATEGTYYNEAFTINLSTDISSLCELVVLDLEDESVDGGLMSTDDNLSHTFYLDILALGPGQAYTIQAACNDSLLPEDSALSSISFNRDPVCGETLYASWTLGHDIECGSGTTGITLAAESITLDCANHSISNSAADGTGIDISSDGITVTGCEINGFARGIYSSGTAGISLLSNIIHDNVAPEEMPMPISGVALFNVQDSTISHNSIYSNDEGIYLSACTGINITQNNIYENTEGTEGSHLGLYDAGGNTNILLYNNYWGHTSCPLYSYQVDSNSADIIDTLPAAGMSDWENTPNCTLQENSPMFNDAIILLPEGSPTAQVVPGFTYFYDESDELQNVTEYMIELGGQEVYAWKVYQYYYYEGDNILLQLDISPANYLIDDISLYTSSLNEGYIFDVSPEGDFGPAGTYNLAISGYTINESDTWANGSYGIRNLDLKFVVTDNLGVSRWVWLLAVYDFTPSQIYASLGGDTTDWSGIDDFTAVEALTFQAVSNESNISRLTFTDPLNLADVEFIHGLRSLSSNLLFSDRSAMLDSDELLALNKNTSITFYGLNTSLNSTALGSKIKSGSSKCPSSVCTNFSYSNLSQEFSFQVTHWSNYSLDLEPPTILDSSPESGTSYYSTRDDVTISVTVDELARCRYSTDNDDEYEDMNLTMERDGYEHSAEVNVTSGTEYRFYVRCNDTVGNVNTAENDVSIRFEIEEDDGDEPGEGSSGGSSTGTNTTPKNEITAIGKRIAMVRGEVYKFKLTGSNDTHSMRILNISADSVKFSISSNPINATVRLGEVKPVDFTGDGKADMTIELISKSEYGVSFILTKIEAAASQPASSPTGINGTGYYEEYKGPGTESPSPQAPAQDEAQQESETQGKKASNSGYEIKIQVPDWNWKNILWVSLSVILMIVISFVVITFTRHHQDHPDSGHEELALPKLDEKAVPKPEKPKGTKERSENLLKRLFGNRASKSKPAKPKKSTKKKADKKIKRKK